MKARMFLKTVRPDLLELETRHIQARVTISMCSANGIPQRKDRFFVVTPRCDRQVELGGQKQDRSSPMSGFETWNLSKGQDDKLTYAGRRTFRMRLQHVEIDDAYSISCRCQRAPNAPKPPGKTPYCSTRDGETATRWDGKQFAPMPCAGEKCPLRQYHGEGNRKMKPAKTVFTLVGRIDEDDYPHLLVSVPTGSDFNVKEFVGLVEGTEKQWADMCEVAGITLPMSWYGLPIELTVYEATGDETRYPRIHYALATDLETVFKISLTHRQALADSVRSLPTSAQHLLTAAVQEADDAEVIFPQDGEGEAPARSAKDSLRALAAGDDDVPPPPDDTDAPADDDPLASLRAELAAATGPAESYAVQMRWLKTAEDSLKVEGKALCEARTKELAARASQK